MNKTRAHKEIHIDMLVEWFVARPTFRAALEARLQAVGLEAHGPLTRMTASDVGHALTGTDDHTHTGFCKWFDELLSQEIGQNDFLRRPGLPRPAPDAKFNGAIGRAVYETRWWTYHATEVRRAVNRNKAILEVIEG
jgi:hypothetical protein